MTDGERQLIASRLVDKGLLPYDGGVFEMMSGHKDPKTVMRYDHGREDLDQNVINFLNYEN